MSDHVYRGSYGCLTDDCQHWDDGKCRDYMPCILGYTLEQPEVRDLRAQLAAAQADLERERKTWRCFNCGFETADPSEAETHFGERDDAEETRPTCVWWAKMSAEEKVQEFQSLLRELNAERDEAGRQRERIEGLEYRLLEYENLTYSRFKCRTINDAFNLYDSMEGRALAAEQRAERAEAEAARLREALEKTATSLEVDATFWIPGLRDNLRNPYARRVFEALRNAASGIRKTATLPSAPAEQPAPADEVEPVELPRCPECGYNREDSAMWLDHHLCKGKIPEQPAPYAGESDANRISHELHAEWRQQHPDCDCTCVHCGHGEHNSCTHSCDEDLRLINEARWSNRHA